MNLKGNTILITGGSEGIGYALAKILEPENRVIICGRSEGKLHRAKTALPSLHTEVCDITDPQARTEIIRRLIRQFPELNILVNNAGGKTVTDLQNGEGVHGALQDDLALNFLAPAALATELLPHFHSRREAAIVNVTTGLVYLPKASQAFYCAAKAALHSYSQSLRWALEGTNVEVYEAMPSLVDTAFHQGRLPQNLPAISANQAAEAIVEGVRIKRLENRIGKSALAPWLSLFAPRRGLALVNR